MNAKVLILVFAAFYQVSAQLPGLFPNPLGTTGVPPFLGSMNTNWARPYYTAAAEGWRTYFEQLQQARNQLFQTLSTLQNTAQNASGTGREAINHILSALSAQSKHAHDDDETQPQILGDLTPPAVEVPAHQETQIVTTVTRPTLPQVQSDVQHVRPQQGHAVVTSTLSQGQNAARQPQTVGLQTVTTATRPLTSQVTSGTVPQVGTQIVSQVPQVGQVGQVGSQVPWVGK